MYVDKFRLYLKIIYFIVELTKQKIFTSMYYCFIYNPQFLRETFRCGPTLHYRQQETCHVLCEMVSLVERHGALSVTLIKIMDLLK